MIVSTTLAGPGAEASIVDALRSCSHLVDLHIVIMSGAPEDLVEQLNEAMPQAKLWFQWLDWPNSYGEARTAALRIAEERGATWALTVDCDERIEIPKLDPPPPGFDALCVGDRDLLYQKPRLLRCGAGLRWEWPCAERLVGPDGKPPAMARISGSFWELPKDAAAEQRRAERGAAEMPKILAAEGDNAHARRHLAECLLILGRTEEARTQFAYAYVGQDWPQFERSWCLYRLAELNCVAGDFRAARSIAATALAEDPGLIQELGWVIAHANAKLNNYTAAALWASYVLLAPIDESRGGHRSKTWRDGAQKLLASIEGAVRAQRPQAWTPDDFAARAEFAPDYARLARALVETLSFGGHLDLGAGNGLLVGAMREAGVQSFGYEAREEARAACPAELDPFMDFGLPLEQWGSDTGVHGFRCDHDLVSCVEVAEHIPAERADELVDAVCSRARRWVYFSAAAPGQGGHGHVNEQPQGYWAEKFRARGWTIDEAATRQLVAKLAGIRVCTWLQRNALILKPL